MDNKITVVLADTNEDFRAMLQETLEKTGEFDVVGSAADGITALELVDKKKPKLLITDLLLPELDGFGLLDRLTKLSSRPETIIVSAQYRDSIVAQAMAMDVAFFMPKPCELESLLDRMRQTCRPQEPAEDAVQALEREVTAVIHEVGVPAHIKGYQYVREAIIIAVQDMDVINAVTDDFKAILEMLTAFLFEPYLAALEEKDFAKRWNAVSNQWN